MRQHSHALIVFASLLACGPVVFGSPQTEKNASIAGPSHPIQGSGSRASLGVSTGQAVQVELTHNIRAKKAKAGDVVKARTVTALILPGQVVVPEGSEVIGHVTQVSGGAASGNTTIAIAFDRFELRKKQIVAANVAIRSGAMHEQAVQPVVLDDQIDDSGFPPPKSTAPNTQRPTHMAVGGFTNSTKPRSQQTPPSTASPEPAPSTVQNEDNRGDMRAVRKGRLIGMPGVALRLDEVSGAATFESANRKLELKSGLQLMLNVEAVKAVAPTAGSAPR